MTTTTLQTQVVNESSAACAAFNEANASSIQAGLILPKEPLPRILKDEADQAERQKRMQVIADKRLTMLRTLFPDITIKGFGNRDYNRWNDVTVWFDTDRSDNLWLHMSILGGHERKVRVLRDYVLDAAFTKRVTEKRDELHGTYVSRMQSQARTQQYEQTRALYIKTNEALIKRVYGSTYIDPTKIVVHENGRAAFNGASGVPYNQALYVSQWHVVATTLEQQRAEIKRMFEVFTTTDEA